MITAHYMTLKVDMRKEFRDEFSCAALDAPEFISSGGHYNATVEPDSDYAIPLPMCETRGGFRLI